MAAPERGRCLVICLVMQFLLNNASEFVAASQHDETDDCNRWEMIAGCFSGCLSAGLADDVRLWRHRPNRRRGRQ